jgi:hypothetical protein
MVDHEFGIEPRVAELEFDTMADLQTAMASPEGQSAAAQQPLSVDNVLVEDNHERRGCSTYSAATY